MESIGLLGETLIIQAVAGWPVFVLALMCLSLLLRLRLRLAWFRVLSALACAAGFSVVLACLVWWSWPPAVGGPMFSFVHLPALVGSFVVCSIVGWHARRSVA